MIFWVTRVLKALSSTANNAPYGRRKEEGGGKGERGDGACCLKRGASVGNERVKGGGACVEH